MRNEVQLIISLPHAVAGQSVQPLREKQGTVGFTLPSLRLGAGHHLVEHQAWQSNDLPPPRRGLQTAPGRGLWHVCHDRPQSLVHMPHAPLRRTAG